MGRHLSTKKTYKEVVVGRSKEDNEENTQNKNPIFMKEQGRSNKEMTKVIYRDIHKELWEEL